MKTYDISLPLHADSLRWPGKNSLRLTSTRSLLRGDPCTCHSFSMDIHLGTHIDAPAHFFPDGNTVEQVLPETMIGPCRVVEFDGPESEIPHDVLDGVEEKRLLFKTRNSELLSRTAFEESFVSFSERLAARLVHDGVLVAGTDYFSVDRFDSQNQPVHR